MTDGGSLKSLKVIPSARAAATGISRRLKLKENSYNWTLEYFYCITPEGIDPSIPLGNGWVHLEVGSHHAVGKEEDWKIIELN